MPAGHYEIVRYHEIIEQAEDNCDSLTKELLQTKTSLVEVEEEKKRLEGEAAQLKEMLRREHDSAEGENTRNQAIIGDYKQVRVVLALLRLTHEACLRLCLAINVFFYPLVLQICSQLSERLEKQQVGNREELTRLKVRSIFRTHYLSPMGVFTLHASNIKGFACASRPASCERGLGI